MLFGNEAAKLTDILAENGINYNYLYSIKKANSFESAFSTYNLEIKPILGQSLSLLLLRIQRCSHL